MIHPFDTILQSRFGGLIRHGSHEPDGNACLLEVATIARARTWSDDPDHAGLPDLLAPAARALWAWPEWSEAQRKALTDRVTLRLICEVLPDVFVAVGLAEHAEKMRSAPDLAGAASAAARAAWAAEAAARAANRVLTLACTIWREEAEAVR